MTDEESDWQKRYIENIEHPSRNSSPEIKTYVEAYVAKIRKSWEDMRKEGLSNRDIQIRAEYVGPWRQFFEEYIYIQFFLYLSFISCG